MSNSAIKKVTVLNFEGEKETVNVKVNEDRNEYSKSDDIWIRNPNKQNVSPIDINNYFNEEEIKILVENEIKNSKLNIPDIEIENFMYKIQKQVK